VSFLSGKSPVFSPVISKDLGSSKVEVSFLLFSTLVINLSGLISPHCYEPKLDFKALLPELSEAESSERLRLIFFSSAKNWLFLMVYEVNRVFDEL